MAASIPTAPPAVAGQSSPEREILTEAARAFLTDLHHRFDGRRLALLQARVERQARFDAGELPDFLSETATRIVGEVKGINRVTYDITSKPPGTIEWE